MASIKYGQLERSSTVKSSVTTWHPRGTFTLKVKMCSACLYGEHGHCDHHFLCSCVCREDLKPALAIQHEDMAYRGLI